MSSEEATSIPTQTIGLPTRPRASADVPPRIPDYRFVKVIGQGAFGTVWLVEEPMVGLFRAIKVLHAHAAADRSAVSKDAAVSRIERELEGIHAYQAQAKDHPHLVRILKTGLCALPEPEQDRDGEDQSRDGEDQSRDREGVGHCPHPKGPPGERQPLADARGSDNRPRQAVYYVMEIADHAGGSQPHHPHDYEPLTLATLLRQKGRLSAGRVVEHASALLDAIDHMHKAGLHHRDVKPANCLFANGVLKLADMGLTASDTTTDSVGTPAYMPPIPNIGRLPAGIDRGPLADARGSDQGRDSEGAVSAQTRRPGGFDKAPLADARGSDQKLDGAASRSDAENGTPARPQPDDLYALGKVMYVMTTGQGAADFPDWPADLDPAGDPKHGLPPEPRLAALRELINALCHPNAGRRLTNIREVRHRLTALASRPSAPATSRRRVALMVGLAAAVGFYAGAWTATRWNKPEDPMSRVYGVLPYSGEFEHEYLQWEGATYGLMRSHRPGERYTLPCLGTFVTFWDIQTRIEKGMLEVCGAFQIFQESNVVQRDITNPNGAIRQVCLCVGDKLHIAYQGQPGAKPGIYQSFGCRGVTGFPLSEIGVREGEQVMVYLAVSSCYSQASAEEVYRDPVGRTELLKQAHSIAIVTRVSAEEAARLRVKEEFAD